MKAGQDVWLVGVNVGMYGRGAWLGFNSCAG